MTVPKLAIAIPTYCRSAMLHENLTVLLHELRRLKVPVYISDDSPDDKTEVAAAEMRRRYPDLHYRRNAPKLGHDENLLAALEWPDADYVWLLGDSLRIDESRFTEILDFLAGQDMLFLNIRTPDGPSIKAVTDEAALTLVRERLWHQTMTGATIFSRRVVEWVRGARPHIYRNFPQLSVVLGFATESSVCIGWFGKRAVRLSKSKESYWRNMAVDTFVDDWVALVCAHPRVIPARYLRNVLKSHSKKSDLFNVSNILCFRREGQLTWNSRNRRHFFDVMHLPRVVVLGLLLIPFPLLDFSVRAIRRLTSQLKTLSRLNTQRDNF